MCQMKTRPAIGCLDGPKLNEQEQAKLLQEMARLPEDALKRPQYLHDYRLYVLLCFVCLLEEDEYKYNITSVLIL